VKSLSLGTGPVYRNRVNSHPFTDSCAEPKLEKRFFTTWRYLAEYEGMAGVKNLESLKKMFPPGLEGLDEGDSV
jgi:hypothetical protein